MNKAYRLIWSKAKDAWVIAAEIVKGNGGPPPITVGAIVVAAALSLAAGGASALPTAPTVVNGTVGMTTTGNTLTVTNSPNSIINWQAFSIAANETVRFNQQGALSAILNRVTGADPSQILGALQSNGRVFLINPNGIIFGQGSRIDVAGLVASSLGISNSDFLAGSYRFSGDAAAGAVKNQGTITTTSGGMVWLISPNVENSGIITSPNGSVMLAAGQSVHMVDPQRPEIAVVVSAPTDKAVNMGEILVQGGNAGMYGSLVSQQGVLNADSVVAGPGGKIFLKSTVSTTLGANSVTSANAMDTGDGGRIIVWSDGDTKVAGTLSATGGANGGNGGFIETSGTHVKIDGTTRVNTLAPSGKIGTWLIDPSDFTIAASGGDISGYNLSKNLGTTSVNIYSTDGTVNTTNGNGDIFVNDAITWGAATHLALHADRNIAINAAIIATDLAATLTLDARGTTTQGVNAPITAANLELLRGNFTLTNAENAIGTLAAGKLDTVTAANSITVGNITLINNQGLTIGTVGSSDGINSTGTVNLTATGQSIIGQPGQAGIVVSSLITAASVNITGYGGKGADCTTAGCTEGKGGNGVEVNSSITASGDVVIRGFGGNGGKSTADYTSVNTGGNGGNGGNGIYVSQGSVIKSTGGGYTIRLEGSGGKGGDAAGGNFYSGNYAGGMTYGDANGGAGGHGIYLRGQIGERALAANVVMTGTGGDGGSATGGSATGYGGGGYAKGGDGGKGLYLKGPSLGRVYAGNGSIDLQGTGVKGGGGTGGVGTSAYAGGSAKGGSGGKGLSIANYALVQAYGTGNIVLTGIGGDGGAGTGGSGGLGTGDGFGGSGGDGVHLYNSQVSSYDRNSSSWSRTSNNPITLTGTGGAGGFGSGGPGSYGGRGGNGNFIYGWSYGFNPMVLTNAGITLNSFGGAGGGSSGGSGGRGGIGLYVEEHLGGSEWSAAIQSYSSISITGNGGNGGTGSGGNGVQGYGVKDAWTGGEGAVLAPSVHVAAQGGISLYGIVNTITLDNSGSRDISFTQNYGTTTNNIGDYGVTVSGTNQVAGGGFTVTDARGVGTGLTLGGISTLNGPITLQAAGNNWNTLNDINIGGAINAGTGSVTITAGTTTYVGSINSLPGGSITAGSATLTATNGIGSNAALQTAVGVLSASNSGSGNIQISNSGTLSVTNLVNVGGSITLDNFGAVTLDGTVYAGFSPGPTYANPSCDITVIAHSPLTVNGPVAATGNVFLGAGASGTPLDNLLISSTGSVAGQNITLSAGNYVTMIGAVNYSTQGPNGTLTIIQGLNPPPPALPFLTSQMVANYINDTVRTMGRESTDLTDEDNDIYLGGKDGEGNKVTYCN
jgi:filamentous hemagglutinin family protein